MAMRLFLIYAVVELAVIVALASTIGFGWTVLALLGTFVLGLALAGSQVKRHIRRLRSRAAPRRRVRSPTARWSRWAPCWCSSPAWSRTVAGLLLLLPPTRAVARPVLTALAARRMPLITVATGRSRPADAGHGDYIDGEVIDVVDVEPPRLPPHPD